MNKRWRDFAVTCICATLLTACRGNGGLAPAAPALAGASIASSQSARPALTQEGIVYAFGGGADGANPYGGLHYGKDSELYGTTYAGGTTGAGTVFKVSLSGSESVIYTFQAGNDGATPQSGLVEGKNGGLYGDTDFGGSTSLCNGHGCGTVYELMPKGSGYAERILYAFQRGSDGGGPVASLLIDKKGALYGTTIHGGGGTECTPSIIGCGTVFKLTPAGSGYAETILYSFQGGSDGAIPTDALIADSKGALYGTTSYGGGGNCSAGSLASGCGTVFKLTPTGSGYNETLLYSFKGGSDDGAAPRAALLAGKNGVLYGTTQQGGAKNGAGKGTVFELTPSGSGYTERVLYSFKGGTDGADPDDGPGLYADANGALLSTTAAGGGATACKAGCGTVFKLTPTGSSYAETVLYSFQDGSGDGATPYGSVIADRTGALYGTTFSGASRKCPKGCGVVFRVSP